MKVIPIPPLSALDFMATSDMQLMLPVKEIWETTGKFRFKYGDAFFDAAGRKDFIILDNGIAENEPCEWKKLLEIADNCEVGEIVLPDIMGDAKGTLWAIKDVWFGRPRQYQYMGVAQGSSGMEIRKLIEHLISLGVQTIGLPRLLLDVRPTLRLELVKWMVSEGLSDSVNIHLLGMNVLCISELDMFRSEGVSEHVRSVDTSMPFVAAFNGVRMRDFKMVIPNRPKGYFMHEAFDKNLAMDNLRWLRGEEA